MTAPPRGRRTESGSQNSTVVPLSGVPVTVHQPPAVSARSRISIRPKCSSGSGGVSDVRNPMPSSTTRASVPPSTVDREMSTALAPACLRTLVIASWQIRKIVIAVSVGGSSVELVVVQRRHQAPAGHHVAQVVGRARRPGRAGRSRWAAAGTPACAAGEIVSRTASSSWSRVARCSSGSRPASSCSRMPTATIDWMESSCTSHAIRRRSSSWACTRWPSSLRRSSSACSAARRSVRSRVTLPKPRSSPLVVVERGDDDVGPEAGAVLADAPALVLEAALGDGGLELAGGLAGGVVLGGVEDEKCLPMISSAR